MEVKEATEEDILYLRDELKKHLPSSMTVYGILNVGYRYGRMDRNKSKLYIPKSRDAPIFVFAAHLADIEVKDANCYWDMDKYSDEDIRSLLISIPNWDWTEPFYFNACSIPILYKIKDFLVGSEGLTKGKIQLFDGTEGFAYQKAEPNHDPERFTAEDFKIDRIDPNTAAHLHSNWLHSYSHSVNSIRRNIECFPSAGAYCVNPKFNQKILESVELGGGSINSKRKLPVSFSILKFNGEIALTTTLPGFEKLGLATALTRRMANMCLEEGIFHLVMIEDLNKASIRFHEKLGFKRTGRFGWHYYVPAEGYDAYKLGYNDKNNIKT